MKLHRDHALPEHLGLIATQCKPAVDDDEANGHAARYLQTRRGAEGSVRGRFRLAAGGGKAMLIALEAPVRRQGDADTRSAGQRRVDALVELAEQTLRHGQLPEDGGQRPQLCYLLPAGLAARRADRAGCPTCTTCPTHRPVSLADTVTASLPGQPGVPAEWASDAAAPWLTASASSRGI